MLFSGQCMAQNNIDLELLYLKNGSVIKGIILQRDTIGEVQIFTAEGITFSYKYSDVLKITPYVPPTLPVVKTVPVKTTLPPKPVERKGLYVLAKGGLLPNGLYSIYASVGYRINSQIHIGLGTGFDGYSDIQYGVSPNYNSGLTHSSDGIVPVYLDSRFFFSKDPTAMFVYVNAGYSWLVSGGQVYTHDASNFSVQTLYQTTNAGAFAATGFGLKFPISRRRELFFDLGIKIQNFSTNVMTKSISSSSSQFTISQPNNVDRSAFTPCWSFGVIF